MDAFYLNFTKHAPYTLNSSCRDTLPSLLMATAALPDLQPSPLPSTAGTPRRRIPCPRVGASVVVAAVAVLARAAAAALWTGAPWNSETWKAVAVLDTHPGVCFENSGVSFRCPFSCTIYNPGYKSRPQREAHVRMERGATEKLGQKGAIPWTCGQVTACLTSVLKGDRRRRGKTYRRLDCIPHVPALVPSATPTALATIAVNLTPCPDRIAPDGSLQRDTSVNITRSRPRHR